MHLAPIRAFKEGFIAEIIVFYILEWKGKCYSQNTRKQGPDKKWLNKHVVSLKVKAGSAILRL